MTGKEFKARIQKASKARQNPTIGRYGERIYAEVMRNQGHKVESLHSRGRDFCVNNIEVDVKASVPRGRTSSCGAPIWPRSRSKRGVFYPRVMFYDDSIVVGSDEQGYPLGVYTLTWSEAAHIREEGLNAEDQWGEKGEVDDEVSEKQQRMLSELRQRLRSNWGMSAKVVYRDNPTAQKAMGKWGPESFHATKRQRASHDLVVLVYFDGPEVIEVFAYPMRCSGEIAWGRKRVGPNLNRRMTFDPATLDAKFRFKSLEDFELTFLSRFPRS